MPLFERLAMYFAVKGLPAPDPVAAPQPPLIDNLFAPEIFATGTAGFANLNGVIVLTLQSVRCDHSREQPTVERFVVARIALTTIAALELVGGLNQFLEQQGLSTSKMIAAGSTFQ